jgi:hypothetical protein
MSRLRRGVVDRFQDTGKIEKKRQFRASEVNEIVVKHASGNNMD